MDYDDQNIFAKILRGEIPADKVYENDDVFAFRDVQPQAPTPAQREVPGEPAPRHPPQNDRAAPPPCPSRREIPRLKRRAPLTDI